MTGQLNHHLYFFLKPSPGAARAIADRRESAAPGFRPVAAPRLHVTIGKIGRFADTPVALIALIADLLADCRLPPCPLAFDRIAGTRNGALLVPGGRLAGFETLQKELAALLGLHPALWQYVKPHVTAGHNGPLSPARAIDPVRWTADTLFLVESLYGQTIHVTHASWALTRDREQAA